MIVEIDSDDEDEPKAPTGPDGWYTTKQKGKGVPRPKDQRDFLCEYVTSGHTKSGKAKAAPKPTWAKSSAPSSPDQFK